METQFPPVKVVWRRQSKLKRIEATFYDSVAMRSSEIDRTASVTKLGAAFVSVIRLSEYSVQLKFDHFKFRQLAQLVRVQSPSLV